MPMRAPAPDRREGGVLIFCLLVIVIGAFVLAAWTQMLAGRIHSIEAAALTQQRRISLANSRSLAEQYLRESMALGNATSSNATLSSNWGRFSLSFTATNTLTSTNQAVMLNPFSPFGADGFVSTPLVVGNGLVVTLEAGNATSGGVTTNRNFYLRSRSPLPGGFPLVLHTSANATNFTGLVVGTNSGGGSALVFASPPSLSLAPSATNYVSTNTRFVSTAPGSSVNAPQLPIALVPVTSGASGYEGRLDDPLARSRAITGISAAVSANLPDALPVMDTAVFTGSSLSEYRVIGPLPANMTFSAVSLENISTTHGPSSMLSFGPHPTAPPQQTGPNTITYNYFNQDFKIKYASDNVQYWKSPGWETINAENEILIFNSNGTASVQNIDTSQKLDFNTGGTQRAVLFVPPAGTLMVFTDTSIYFGPVSDKLEGALVYRKSEYFQPGGVAFVALPGLKTAGGIWEVAPPPIVTKFNPSIESSYRCQFPDQNISIYELDTGQLYTIQDNSNVPLIEIDPDGASPWKIRAGANSDSAILHHTGSITGNATNLADPTGYAEPYNWNRWLTILNSSTTLDPGLTTSAILFGYIEDTAVGQEPLALELQNADNERNTGLVIERSANGATITAPAGRAWNLSATFLDTPVTFNAGAGFNILGGIRANRSVTSPTNPITLSPNTSPAPLEPFLDRVGWLESWQQ